MNAVVPHPDRIFTADPLSGRQPRRHRQQLPPPGQRGHQVQVAAGDVGGGITEHGLGGRVPGGDAVVGGHGQHGVARRLGDDGQPANRLLGLFLLCDVGGDGRGADDVATGSPHRRDGHRDVDDLAVLPDPDRLEVLDALALANAVQERGHLVGSLRWSEEREGQAQHLLARVSVDALRRRIPVDDRSVQGVGQDGILGGFDDSRQAAEGLFGLVAVGDVADGGRDERSGLGLEGAEADLDGELGAVLAEGEQCDPGSHGPDAGGGEVAGPVPGVLAAKPLGDQHLDGLPEKFGPVVPEDPLGLGVDELDPAIRPDDDHGVRGRLQQRPEPLLDPAALGHLPDGGQNEQALGRLEWNQVHVERKIGPVLPPGRELEAGPEELLGQLGQVLQRERSVGVAGPVRHKSLDGLAHELAPPISEELFGAGVERHDPPGELEDQQTVGRGRQNLRRRLRTDSGFRAIPGFLVRVQGTSGAQAERDNGPAAGRIKKLASAAWNQTNFTRQFATFRPTATVRPHRCSGLCASFPSTGSALQGSGHAAVPLAFSRTEAYFIAYLRYRAQATSSR